MPKGASGNFPLSSVASQVLKQPVLNALRGAFIFVFQEVLHMWGNLSLLVNLRKTQGRILSLL